MSKKNKINYHEHEEPENFPNISNVASANECTGLIPTPPESDDQMESYQSLSSMEIPKKAPSKKQIREGVYDNPPPDVLN